MYAWGMVGYFASVLAEKGLFDKKWVIYVYGFVASVLYGLLLDTWHIIGFVHPITVESATLAYIAGLTFNIPHAISTVLFLLAIYLPWRKKLERIKTKYALGIPDFTPDIPKSSETSEGSSLSDPSKVSAET